MAARAAPMAALLACLLAAPAACAVDAHVPEAVWDSEVPVAVTGYPSGSTITIKVGGQTYTDTATGASYTTSVFSVPAGYQAWVVNASKGGTGTEERGFVYVAPRLAALKAGVDANVDAVDALGDALGDDLGAAQENLTALADEITRLHARLDQLELSILAGGNGTSGLGANLTGIRETLDGLQSRILAGVNGLLEAQSGTAPGDGNGTAFVSSGAETAAPSLMETVAALASAVAVLVALGLGYLVWQQAARTREMMVFVLAVAGKAGVTADSPEFRQALAAAGGGKKKGKKKKGDDDEEEEEP